MSDDEVRDVLVLALEGDDPGLGPDIGALLSKGRRLRRRNRIRKGIAAAAAVACLVGGSAWFTGAFDTSAGPGPATSVSPAPRTASGVPVPEASSGPLVLDPAFTAGDARGVLVNCIDHHAKAAPTTASGDPAYPRFTERDPDKYRILYFGPFIPNPGPTTWGTALLAVDSEGNADYCRNSPDGWYSARDIRRVPDQSAARPAAMSVARNDLCYPDLAKRPQPSPEFPFRWLDFGRLPDPKAVRVTVEYGGKTQDAALSHGFWFAAGELVRPETYTPIIRSYDADGRLLYDSTQAGPRSRPLS
ncbi:hypothetical protein [Yinghuangia soli]|uniref:Uncharacterized protein n=1 Tax=Yinghuangia soli TaxID=2908204 RepID=A0AA41U213_9ACTN|nr:hypothetical protein [Yinghuangia soli]MCF2530236.1 hypothetical protein [Yinghuangia soli]